MYRSLQHIIRGHAHFLSSLRYSSTETSGRIHALVTGPPGVGKTTLVKKVCSELQRRHDGWLDVRGFSMEEVRESYSWGGKEHAGPKIGYDVVTMTGHRGTLARVDVGGLHRFKFGKGTAKKRKKNMFVGKYRVLLRSFERVALPSLQTPASLLQIEDNSQQPRGHLYVVDEVGKMGLFSRSFVTSIRGLLRQGSQQPRPHSKETGPVVVMATIPASGQTHKVTRELISREDCILFEVSEENRDSLVTEITDFLSQNLTK